MELSREEEMQAYSDALGALLIAVGRQLDALRLVADLRLLADEAQRAGHGPSAGALDALVQAAEARLLGKAGEH